MPLQVAEVSGELPTFALFAPLQPGTTKKYNLKGTGPIVQRALSGLMTIEQLLDASTTCLMRAKPSPVRPSSSSKLV